MPDDTPAPPDLAAIAARLAAATPGPWEFHDDGGIYEIPGYLSNGAVDFMGIGYWNEADAAFIAAAPADMAALLARIAALERALEHATLVIAQYELDIRNSDWTGVNLAAVGFCQGVIYRRALRTIQQLARP